MSLGPRTVPEPRTRANPALPDPRGSGSHMASALSPCADGCPTAPCCAPSLLLCTLLPAPHRYHLPHPSPAPHPVPHPPPRAAAPAPQALQPPWGRLCSCRHPSDTNPARSPAAAPLTASPLPAAVRVPAVPPSYLGPLALGLHEEQDAGVRLVEGVAVQQVLTAHPQLHLGEHGQGRLGGRLAHGGWARWGVGGPVGEGHVVAAGWRGWPTPSLLSGSRAGARHAWGASPCGARRGAGRSLVAAGAGGKLQWVGGGDLRDPV